MDEDSTGSHNIRRSGDAMQSIFEDCLPEFVTLLGLVDSKASKQDDGDRMIRQSLRHPGRHFFPVSAAGRNRIIGNDPIGAVNDVVARGFALLIRLGKALQPIGERSVSAAVEMTQVMRPCQRFNLRKGWDILLRIAQEWKAPATAFLTRESAAQADPRPL